MSLWHSAVEIVVTHEFEQAFVSCALSRLIVGMAIFQKDDWATVVHLPIDEHRDALLQFWVIGSSPNRLHVDDEEHMFCDSDVVAKLENVH